MTVLLLEFFVVGEAPSNAESRKRYIPQIEEIVEILLHGERFCVSRR